MIKLTHGEVFSFGAAAAMAAVGYADPELAPATGSISGLVFAVAFERAFSSLGKSEEVQRKRIVVAAVTGMLSGATAGLIRRQVSRGNKR